MRRSPALLCAAAMSFALTSIASAETVRIGYIDPLSGPFANVGDQGLKHFMYAAEVINERNGPDGIQFEIVPFDNKLNPAESLVQLQKAIDDGIQYVTQGNGSSVASALIDGVEKNNQRYPDEPALFLNYAAVDPAFTNDRCSFWHFRFDADANMKMAALTDWLADQPDLKRVYIIGQDYSFGKAVSAAAKRMIAEKRPDMEIVGDEFHPLAKVKDFTPYVQKIMQADADVVITGNWGPDMALLIKAASDAGQDAPYLTYYGGGLGAVTAMGASAVDRVKQITEFHENLDDLPDDLVATMDDFEETYNGLDYYYHRVFVLMEMLNKAIDEAGTANPMDVALALEGMTHETVTGTVTMRKDNHQLIQPMYVSTLAADTERDVEGSGFGFRTDPDGAIAAAVTRTDTTCEMERPD